MKYAGLILLVPILGFLSRDYQPVEENEISVIVPVTCHKGMVLIQDRGAIRKEDLCYRPNFFSKYSKLYPANCPTHKPIELDVSYFVDLLLGNGPKLNKIIQKGRDYCVVLIPVQEEFKSASSDYGN